MKRKTSNRGAKYESLDVYQASLTPDDLAAVRRTLAKRANQRMVRLEKATSSITGEKYSEIGALPIAQEYLSRSGRKRFTENLNAKMDYEQQRREIVQIQAFLQAKTSTVAGIREIESKRVNTFESGKWGSSKWTGKERRKLLFSSTKEFYDFFHSSTYRELLSDGFTSEQVIEAYDTARETYDGRDEEAIEALNVALQRFREKGSISLKELKEAAGTKVI